MTANTTHPLVTTYLEELGLLLAGVEPGERAEVLAGVREHLEAALDAHDLVGDAEVRAALAELGPPQPSRMRRMPAARLTLLRHPPGSAR